MFVRVMTSCQTLTMDFSRRVLSKSASTSTFTCERLHCFVSAVFNASKNTLSSQLITDSWDTNRNTRRGEFANCRRKYVLSCVILCSRKYRKEKKKKKVTLPGEWPFRCSPRVVMHSLQLYYVHFIIHSRLLIVFLIN